MDFILTSNSSLLGDMGGGEKGRKECGGRREKKKRGRREKKKRENYG